MGPSPTPTSLTSVAAYVKPLLPIELQRVTNATLLFL